MQLLAAPEREVLYGGQVGGGKSIGLLMDAALYADEPDYSSLLARRTFADLALPGALMDLAFEWWDSTAAHWSERDKKWTFPSGATISFGYLDGPRDYLRYQGSAFHRIGIDESTQIREHDIRYMFSRMRRPAGSRVPVAMRLASNPGGESHGYHVETFVDPAEPDPNRRFIPAGLEDNPHLDTEEYERSLANLDEITYRQLRRGEWIEHTDDAYFRREWFGRYDPEDHRIWNRATRRFAALDTANTAGQTSAYSALTVGDLQPDYTLPLRYVARERLEFPDLVEWTVDELAPFAIDRKLAAVFIEDAASGKQLLQTLRRSGPAWLRPLLVGVKPNMSKDGKEVSWKAASVWAKRGMMPLPHPSASVPWLHGYEQELFSVPNSTYKDQADSTAILLNEVERRFGAFSQRWQALMGSRVAAEESAGEVA